MGPNRSLLLEQLAATIHLHANSVSGSRWAQATTATPAIILNYHPAGGETEVVALHTARAFLPWRSRRVDCLIQFLRARVCSRVRTSIQRHPQTEPSQTQELPALRCCLEASALAGTLLPVPSISANPPLSEEAVGSSRNFCCKMFDQVTEFAQAVFFSGPGLC